MEYVENLAGEPYEEGTQESFLVIYHQYGPSDIKDPNHLEELGSVLLLLPTVKSYMDYGLLIIDW